MTKMSHPQVEVAHLQSTLTARCRHPSSMHFIEFSTPTIPLTQPRISGAWQSAEKASA